jgi:hypothetical protein
LNLDSNTREGSESRSTVVTSSFFKVARQYAMISSFRNLKDGCAGRSKLILTIEDDLFDASRALRTAWPSTAQDQEIQESCSWSGTSSLPFEVKLYRRRTHMVVHFKHSPVKINMMTA